MKAQPPIYFHFNTSGFSLRQRTELKRFIAQIFKEEDKALESLNYIFCTDEQLYELNRTYLNHNNLTDIITFELSAPEQPAVSDIYISTDRVRENAQTFTTSFKRELHRVIFHGALHLCGYKDKKKAEQERMRAREDYYLNKYLVSRNTVS